MTLATRLAIAMILLVAVTVAAVGWLGYRNITQAVIPRVLERIEAQSRLRATNLESYVAGARGDLVGYRSAAAINGLIRAHIGGGIDAVDGVSEQTWRERIAARLAAEIEAKPSYGQFRIIGLDDDQRELVRVDRSGPAGAVRVVPTSELEPKSERAYFQETIRLAPGEIYVSPDRPRHPPGRDHGPSHADLAGRDAVVHTRRQAVRHHHRQCRHASGTRPRPFDRRRRGRRYLRREFARRLSRPSRSRARIRLRAGPPHRLAQ